MNLKIYKKERKILITPIRATGLVYLWVDSPFQISEFILKVFFPFFIVYNYCMNKKITSLTLGNNLTINLVVENKKIKVQPILNLLQLGENQPFEFALCFDKKHDTINLLFE